MDVKRILMVMLIAALYGQGSGQSEPKQYCIIGAGPGGMFYEIHTRVTPTSFHKTPLTIYRYRRIAAVARSRCGGYRARTPAVHGHPDT